MSQEIAPQQGACQCGHARFAIVGKPLMRLFCHCSVCQEYNQAAFADISVYRSGDVRLLDDASVAFRAMKAPPAVQRGVCVSCKKPALEYFSMPLMPALTIIPSANVPEESLEDSSMHIFYHRRQADINDALPKHSGFLTSQLCFVGKLLPQLLRGS